ncbi:MAG: hypothetical protein WD749_12480 [Phycisphaerales bacterium]
MGGLLFHQANTPADNTGRGDVQGNGADVNSEGSAGQTPGDRPHERAGTGERAGLARQGTLGQPEAAGEQKRPPALGRSRRAAGCRLAE